jgi:trypsin
MFRSAILLISLCCGVLSIGSVRIAGGTLSQLGQFPYQAYVTMFKDDMTYASCGGGLINSRYVITAAHCLQMIDKVNQVRVVAGVVDITNFTSKSGVKVKSWIIHPEYNPAVSMSNDIALLELPVDVPESNNIQYLSIGTTVPPTGTKVIVSGWGRTPESELGSKSQLFIEYATASDFICAQYWGIGYDKKTMLCTSEGIKGPCEGDSGGPLVYKANANDTRYTAIGLVSYGYPGTCGEASIDAFAKLTSYIPWIAANTPSNPVFATTAPGPTSPPQKLVAPGPGAISSLQKLITFLSAILIVTGLVLICVVVIMAVVIWLLAREKKRRIQFMATGMKLLNTFTNFSRNDGL